MGGELSLPSDEWPAIYQPPTWLSFCSAATKGKGIWYNRKRWKSKKIDEVSKKGKK